MSYEALLENPGVAVLSYFISLLITIVVYGAYPLLYAIFQKKPITAKRYKWVCYGVNFIMLFIVMFGLFQGTSAFPYILWTYIFISVGKKILRDKGLLIEHIEAYTEEAPASQPDIPPQSAGTNEPVSRIAPVGLSSSNTCPRTSSSKGTVIILSVICVLLLIVASMSIFHIHQQQQNINLLNEQIAQLTKQLSATEVKLDASNRSVKSLQKSLSDKKEQISELSSDLRFFNTHVVFISDDNSRIYHKFGCFYFDDSYFWAYNTEAARQKGYQPCSFCFSSYFDSLTN